MEASPSRSPPPQRTNMMEASPPPLQPQPLQSFPFPLPASSSSPSASTVAVGRRLPPPCWSHEETMALIDSYRDKWYSLRRGNLRAVHWQEVADAVGVLCPHSAPAKTSVQCRHKMEKLRKRYRSELQRALSIPNHRFSSAWVYFKKMDDMEKGPSAVESNGVGNGEDEDDDDVAMENDDVNGNEDADCDRGSYLLRVQDPKRSYGDVDFHGSVTNGSGFGIQAPSRFRSKNYGKYDMSQSPNFNYEAIKHGNGSGSSGGLKYTTRVIRNGVVTETESGAKLKSMSNVGKKSKEGDEVNGMVVAIKMLGEGFVRVEKMKMDMMKEIEQTRMEMEMKRTEMILESQQRLVDAFLMGISERVKKAKSGSPQKSSDGK